MYAGKVMVRFDRRRSPFDPGGWSMSGVLEAPAMPQALIGSALQGEATAGAVPGARTRPFAWLEPNTVEVADHIRVFVRCTIRSQGMAHVAAALEFDAAAGRLRFDQFVPWPGGQCKFFIIHDRPSGMYWMLGNLVTNSRDYLGWGQRMEQARYRRSAGERRWLFLHYSIDCLSWFPAGCVARWPDDVHRSFMYPSAAGRRRRPGAAIAHQPRLARPARRRPVHDPSGARLPEPGDGPARRRPASAGEPEGAAGIVSEALPYGSALVLLYDRRRMTTKEQIHQLVNDLPESDLETVKRVLEGLSALSGSSAVETALASAPIDDESVTDEEAQAIEEGERDVEAGRVVTADEVQVRLGL